MVSKASEIRPIDGFWHPGGFHFRSDRLEKSRMAFSFPAERRMRDEYTCQAEYTLLQVNSMVALTLACLGAGGG